MWILFRSDKSHTACPPPASLFLYRWSLLSTPCGAQHSQWHPCTSSCHHPCTSWPNRSWWLFSVLAHHREISVPNRHHKVCLDPPAPCTSPYMWGNHGWEYMISMNMFLCSCIYQVSHTHPYIYKLYWSFEYWPVVVLSRKGAGCKQMLSSYLSTMSSKKAELRSMAFLPLGFFFIAFMMKRVSFSNLSGPDLMSLSSSCNACTWYVSSPINWKSHIEWNRLDTVLTFDPTHLNKMQYIYIYIYIYI